MAWQDIFIFVILACITRASCQKSSLAFVIDTTGSMQDDIYQVKQDADSIFNLIFTEKSTQVENMVLVTFNDPDVQLANSTNRVESKALLSRVNYIAYSGGDCPEMSLTGIKLALENSLPGSFIYVFTDASAKDNEINRTVIDLIQTKQSQVIFVLTGDCENMYDDKYQVYHKIARASSGIVIRVEKNEVQQVLNTIQSTIKGDNNVLTSVETPAQKYAEVSFEIDDYTEYATISVYGTHVEMTLKNEPAVTKNIMLWTRHTKIVKLVDPTPGIYKVTVRGETPTTVVVVGRTDISFKHGFSTSQVQSLNDTTLQPDAYSRSLLSVLVKNSKTSVDVLNVQLLDMNEIALIEPLPVKKVAGNLFTTTVPFEVPPYMFKIQVNARETSTQKNIRRISKIPVSPRIPPYCLIPTHAKSSEKVPLVLTENNEWPNLESSGIYSKVSAGQKLVFACPNQNNVFEKFPRLKQIDVSCEGGASFRFQGRSYSLSELHCKNEFHAILATTNTSCGVNSHIINVGYDINTFVQTYQVCINEGNKVPFFTRMNVSLKIHQVPSFEWHSHPKFNKKNSENAYTCKGLESCCYRKSQLVSAADFSYGAPQYTTLIEPINVIPSWQPCNEERISWEKLSSLVRSHANAIGDPRVTSGTFELKEKNGAVVPRYLWTAFDFDGKAPKVIVYVNDPSPKFEDVLCPDACANGELPWLKPKDQYTYCCTFEDFYDNFSVPPNTLQDKSGIAPVYVHV